MTMDGSADTWPQREEVRLRVLVAVHGHEPATWVIRAGRVVAGWRDARVRVLGIVDARTPSFTSLIPPARRLYAAARTAWREEEEQRVRGALARVIETLSHTAEVVCRQSSTQGLADTILDDARSWAADVIVVAAPPPLSRSWWCQGPVHERLLRCGAGAVLAVPAGREPRRADRVIPRPRAIPRRFRAAAAGWRP